MSQSSDGPGLEERLHQNWSRIAKDILRARLECLDVVHKTFGGDFQLFYIIAVIALRTVEHREFQETPYPEWLSSGRQPPSLTTNVLSISESTGIPEETVRRKVHALIARGWIARNGRSLALSADAVRDLAPVTRAIMHMAASHHRVVSRSLQDDAG